MVEDHVWKCHCCLSQVLVTRHGKQEGSRFMDPRGRRTFKYDHLRKVSSSGCWRRVGKHVLDVITVITFPLCMCVQEAGETQPAQVDDSAESWRAALDRALQAYVKEHYPDGIVTVSHNLVISHSCSGMLSVRCALIRVEFCYTGVWLDFWGAH